VPSHPLRQKALRRWAASDAVLHRIARETPTPYRALETATPFEALVQSIAHQQVSLAAGKSIFAKVQAVAAQQRGADATGDASGPAGASPESLLKAGPDALRAAGLSRPKVKYVLDLAEKATTGTVDLARLSSMPDAQVVEQLTSVKGIGVWTAKMFLLFHLDRPDVLPHEDLGLRIAVAKAYRVTRGNAAKKMIRMGPAWSPYGSLASLTLWNWRRADL
jgi:DNA-3-methyladenine glycosylase II